jgi:hypothetical protein
VSFTKVVAEIERRARTREIGSLQKIRKELKVKSRLAGRSIFHQDTTKDTYAFHYGGRTELQFNVGTEPGERCRHGVAFSFEPSQSLPTPDLLVPSVKRFNDFVRLYANDFADMRMWHWDENGRRSEEYRPIPIEAGLIRKGMFIFMGKMQPFDTIDYDLIVDDFDRFLTLYRFVEGHETYPVVSSQLQKQGFQFKPGCTMKPSETTATFAERELNVNLRHNVIQTALYEHLCSVYGGDKVGTELACANGRVDVVLHYEGRYWFYEIKTSVAARGCISQALPQLLEYSFWPGAQVADRLIVVGEPALDHDSDQYISTLRHRFGLPIEYLQFDMTSCKIIGP